MSGITQTNALSTAAIVPETNTAALGTPSAVSPLTAVFAGAVKENAAKEPTTKTFSASASAAASAADTSATTTIDNHKEDDDDDAVSQTNNVKPKKNSKKSKASGLPFALRAVQPLPSYCANNANVIKAPPGSYDLYPSTFHANSANGIQAPRALTAIQPLPSYYYSFVNVIKAPQGFYDLQPTASAANENLELILNQQRQLQQQQNLDKLNSL